jgi:hypothetical protein
VFDLGGHVPVERVDLRLAEANSVIVADLYSRKDPRDAWNFVTRARFYRIRTPRGDDHNEPIAVPLSGDRYWLARSSSSIAARTDLAPFISNIAVPPAALANGEKLGGGARLAAIKPPFPWRRWILWVVLLGALAALGYMAARLLEETGPPQPPA